MIALLLVICIIIYAVAHGYWGYLIFGMALTIFAFYMNATHPLNKTDRIPDSYCVNRCPKCHSPYVFPTSRGFSLLQSILGGAILGHETYDTPDEEHSTLPLYFLHQFYLPENGPQGLQRQVYSFDYGPVHFSVLDSQFQEEQSERPDLLADELHWLEQDLADSRQPWKVVCFHKTPYYNKAVRANEALKKALLPILDKYQVDLVINGHALFSSEMRGIV